MTSIAVGEITEYQQWEEVIMGMVDWSRFGICRECDEVFLRYGRKIYCSRKCACRVSFRSWAAKNR